jgi:hypothetical protein
LQVKGLQAAQTTKLLEIDGNGYFAVNYEMSPFWRAS